MLDILPITQIILEKIPQNRALVEAYELGSVLKPIVLSKAIMKK